MHELKTIRSRVCEKSDNGRTLSSVPVAVSRIMYIQPRERSCWMGRGGCLGSYIAVHSRNRDNMALPNIWREV